MPTPPGERPRTPEDESGAITQRPGQVLQTEVDKLLKFISTQDEGYDRLEPVPPTLPGPVTTETMARNERRIQGERIATQQDLGPE